MESFDVILVGGGLQSGLCALAALHRRSGLRAAIVERDGRLGGNHTWCFHGGDVEPEDQAWLEPLVVRCWPSYDVAFPGFRRTLDVPYSAVTAERLDEVVGRAVRESSGGAVFCGASATRVAAGEVELADGRRLRAPVVLDARGPEPGDPGGCGFQKFVGLELRLAGPCGLERPLVMDATVPQRDGFRFFYALPFAPDRVLLEDTYFSDRPELDRAALRAGILAASEARGWSVSEVLREEEGVLPMPWRRPAVSVEPPYAGGYRGGWFHPATGYSFPIAVRVARRLADALPGGPGTAAWARWRSEHERQAGFGRLLNRMLFAGIAPDERWRVFARFHRLPEPTIRRFYALRSDWADRVRIVLGSRPHALPTPRMLYRWLTA
ncbi:MAG: lycopene beta-cyclase CrtY [Deltaproteobacteria bacterium]|nr:lycopene beta-cyclase CrtY [Deltaproteobacteria bacterium]